MKISKFLIKCGFEQCPTYQSSLASYSIKVNGETYKAVRVSKRKIRLVNLNTGYEDTSTYFGYTPKSDDFIEFVADHDQFNSLYQYLIQEIRKHTIDKLLVDLP